MTDSIDANRNKRGLPGMASYSVNIYRIPDSPRYKVSLWYQGKAGSLPSLHSEYSMRSIAGYGFRNLAESWCSNGQIPYGYTAMKKS